MTLCQESSIIHTKSFLEAITTLDKGRALEVAAGDGQLTRDLLGSLFQKVDCFDQCPIAVSKLEELRSNIAAIDLVDQYSMQNYQWQQAYTGIFLRWCVGYLGDQQLVDFLKTAKAHLSSTQGFGLRGSSPTAFIFVLDNVLEED